MLVTGGSFVIGSADISEAELETIDGVTAGYSVAASKAVVVDANKDIGDFRNVVAAGACRRCLHLVTANWTYKYYQIVNNTSGELDGSTQNFTFDGTTFTVGGS